MSGSGEQQQEHGRPAASPTASLINMFRPVWTPHRQCPVSLDTRHSVRGETSRIPLSCSSQGKPGWGWGVVLGGRRTCDEDLALWQARPLLPVYLSQQRDAVLPGATWLGPVIVRAEERACVKPLQWGLEGEEIP